MKFQKTYKIVKWTEWNKKLAESISDFKKEFSYNPNILQANSHTFSQFDFLVNVIPNEKNSVSRIDDLTNTSHNVNSKEDVELSSFEFSGVTVEFSVDDKLKDKEFRLVYDSDPGWDNNDDIIDIPIGDYIKEKA